MGNTKRDYRELIPYPLNPKKWKPGDPTIIDRLFESGWDFEDKPRQPGRLRPDINPMKEGWRERVAELTRFGRPRPEIKGWREWGAEPERMGVVGDHRGVPCTWSKMLEAPVADSLEEDTGNAWLLRRVNIDGAEDLLQFIARHWPEIKDKDEPLIYGDFKQFIIKLIRHAKYLHTLAKEYTNTDATKPTTSTGGSGDSYPEDEKLSAQDVLDGRALRGGTYDPRHELQLYLHSGSYRNPTNGEINYNLMHKDMVIAMLLGDRNRRADRYFTWTFYEVMSEELESQAFRDFVDYYHELPQFAKMATFQLFMSEILKETQQEFADRIGVHQSSISRIKKKLYRPYIEILKKHQENAQKSA